MNENREARKKAEREAREARLAADPSIVEHGTLNTYNAWGCRCRACKDALKPRAIFRLMCRMRDRGEIEQVEGGRGKESTWRAV